MRLNAFAISYLLSIIVAAFFAFLFFKEKKKNNGFLKALLILDGALWILGKFLEIMVSDIGLKSLLGKIQYVGLSMHPVVVFFLTLIACGFGRLVNKKTAILASIIPFASFILFITNDLHHLMYKNQAVDSIGFLTVNSISDYGTLLWVSTGFSYLIVAACFFFLIYILITKYNFFKYQALLIILGISIQLFLSIFIIFLKDANTSLVLREISPIIILFSDIIFVVGFSYFKVGEIIPINYRHIIEDIKDPIVVLDNNNKMNFVNNSAKKFFGIDDKYIGKLFEDYWH
jgi:PAS domain-containing protein